MINSRLLSLVRKEFLQIIRDPRTLVIMFVMPIVMLFLLGYSATNDVRNVPIAIFDQDRSQSARDLLNAYRNADYFRFDFAVASVEEMKNLIDAGQAKAGLIIPPDYGDRVAHGEQAQVAFVIDGSDPTIAATALSAATLIGQTKATAVLRASLETRGQGNAINLPVEVRTQVWYNPDLISAYFMIPGLVGMILQYLAVLLTSTAVVRERERGTIEQLIITPIRPWELIVSKLLPYALIAFFDLLEVLVIGTLVFSVPINGDLALLLALSGLFLVTTLGLGLLISTIANTQFEAMLIAIMIQLPAIFLSGFFFPIAAMPQFLQALSYLVPLRYFLIVVRAIQIKGVGLAAVSNEVVALIIFGIVVMGAAAVRFRKRLD
ncbi:MAG TPA: ABC transporter permease [Anaerolineae bacterium]|nr:ABC transporter permease [Anaerolineae bacterium]